MTSLGGSFCVPCDLCGYNPGPNTTWEGEYGCKRFIEAIGAPLAKSVNVDEWVGMEASLEIVHEEWEGVTRAAIARIRAA